MSVQAISWVLGQDIAPASHKLVLVALANYADDTAKCWPSIERLMQDASMSRRSIQSALKALEESGYVSRDARRRENGTRRSDLFTLNMHGATGCMVHEKHGAEIVENAAPHGAAQRRDMVQPVAPLEPSLEPSVISPKGDSPSRMVQIWNEELGGVLTAVRLLTAGRERATRLRLKDTFEGDPQNWRAVCQRIRGSPFLTGKNDRNWTADFDWCLKPANLTKIMEGRYDPRDSGPDDFTARLARMANEG